MKQFIFILTIVLLYSCKSKMNEIIIDNSVSENVEKKFSKFNSFSKGISYIYEESNYKLKDSIYSDCYCYKSNDSIYLSFNLNSCYIKFYIVKNIISSISIHSTDIINTYPNGSYDGTFLKLPSSVNKLKITKPSAFNVNDTICGFFNFESNPYVYKKDSIENRIDKIYGYFKCIILTKEQIVNDSLSIL